MSLSDLASLGSFVSGLAVLVSLVFLFFQMRQMTEQVRQTERNQQALIRQGVRARGLEMQMIRTDTVVSDAIAKAEAGAQEMTAAQFDQFASFELAYFIHVEDAFFQHKEGLLVDSAFATVCGGLTFQLSRPGVRQFWNELSGTIGLFPDEFVKFVNGVAAETPVIVRPDRFDQWKAGVAAMKAKVPQH